jgi:hypothetical protein
MEIADDALKEDLGMTRVEFEGAYAMWRVGADLEALVDTFNCDRTALGWYFIMHGAGGGDRPTHWPGVE